MMGHNSLTRGLWAAAGLAVVFVASPAMAKDECNVAFAPLPATPLVQYDPFKGDTANAEISIEVINQDADACSLRVGVASQVEGGSREMTSGALLLPYRLEKLDGQLVPNQLEARSIDLDIPAGVGARTKLLLRVRVAAGTIVGAGSYSDLLTVRLYQGNSSKAARTDLTFPISSVVVAKAQVNIAGAAGDFASSGFALGSLDFGVLADGAIRNAFVQVRATRPVSISVSSENNGMLRHTTLKNSTAGVPYSASLDGQALNLTTGNTSISRTPPLTLAGISYPLNVKLIGPVANKVAGGYSDLLTFSVVPQ